MSRRGAWHLWSDEQGVKSAPLVAVELPKTGGTTDRRLDRSADGNWIEVSEMRTVDGQRVRVVYAVLVRMGETDHELRRRTAHDRRHLR